MNYYTIDFVYLAMSRSEEVRDVIQNPFSANLILVYTW